MRVRQCIIYPNYPANHITFLFLTLVKVNFSSKSPALKNICKLSTKPFVIINFNESILRLLKTFFSPTPCTMKEKKNPISQKLGDQKQNKVFRCLIFCCVLVHILIIFFLHTTMENKLYTSKLQKSS